MPMTELPWAVRCGSRGKHGSYLGGEADFLRGSRHVTHLPVERSDRVELSEVWYFLSIVQVRHFMSNMWGAI